MATLAVKHDVNVLLGPFNCRRYLILYCKNATTTRVTISQWMTADINILHMAALANTNAYFRCAYEHHFAVTVHVQGFLALFSRIFGGHKDLADPPRRRGAGLRSCLTLSTSDTGHCSTLSIPHARIQKRGEKRGNIWKHLTGASTGGFLTVSDCTKRTLKGGEMAKSDRQRSLRSEEFFFDSEASLLDQHDLEMSSCTFNDVFDSRDSRTFLINVQVLLEAARFLESADRKDGSEFYCAAFEFINVSFQVNDPFTSIMRWRLCVCAQPSADTAHKDKRMG